jgi:vitamin K-dependent gamma-carboxylase
MPSTAFVMSWMGALFDCTIVGWLLWRRSRPFAFAVLVAFHIGTAMLFQIGVFPWLMIGASLVFFPPDWPSRLRARVTGAREARVAAPAGVAPRIGRGASVFLVGFAIVQVLLPLRHLAYPGDVRWTDEGYYGSWRVMVTEKTGYLQFRVRLPDTGEVRVVDPRSVLEPWQVPQTSIRPDLLHAAALIVADEYRARGAAHVEVYADAFVSFMGRPATRLVDPDVDLAALPRTLGHQPWILPVSAGS